MTDAAALSVPIALPTASFVGVRVDLQAAPSAADLTAPATLSQVALPFVLCEIWTPADLPRPVADVHPRQDLAALQRFRPTVHVRTEQVISWSRSSRMNC